MDALYMLLPSPAGNAEHQREQQKNDRNPEEKLCTLHRGSGDAAKAEYASDKRDDQKNKRPMQKIAEIHSVTSQTKWFDDITALAIDGSKRCKNIIGQRWPHPVHKHVEK